MIIDGIEFYRIEINQKKSKYTGHIKIKLIFINNTLPNSQQGGKIVCGDHIATIAIL